MMNPSESRPPIGSLRMDPASRQERRRARTRARLLRATQQAIADKGPEATTVAAIAHAADVGFGTFYLYFPSKDAAIEAVAKEVVEELGAALDGLTLALSDPAEVLAVSIRHLVGRVDRDPMWSWFVVRSGMANQVLAQSLGRRLRRDLSKGWQVGRFTCDPDHLVALSIGAVAQASMRARLDGVVGTDVGELAAEHVLRLVGIGTEEARLVARRPLPDVATGPGRSLLERPHGLSRPTGRRHEE